jgi:hypothetical protein
MREGFILSSAPGADYARTLVRFCFSGLGKKSKKVEKSLYEGIFWKNFTTDHANLYFDIFS